MKLDDRAHRASLDIRRAIGKVGTDSALGSAHGFHRARLARERNLRMGAGLLALAVGAIGIAVVVQALSPSPRPEPAVPTSRSGSILYGRWDERLQQARWFTVKPDGSNLRDLGVTATCAVWFPGGTEILITNDAAVGSGHPLRPAVIEPDGSRLRPLDATRNPHLNLGCGDVSPDGTRIALEGFGQGGRRGLNGIYSVRASDGGGLVRLLRGPVSPPRYSPDGSRLAFFDTKAGISPQGAGALFVMDADGTDVIRLTPWGAAFADLAWSPDGEWIAFVRPYGELFLVRPDGSDLHAVPLRIPAGMGAQNPSWSPDGTLIVFSLQRADGAEIYVVRPDGSGLRRVTAAAGVQAQSPDWGFRSQ